MSTETPSRKICDGVVLVVAYALVDVRTIVSVITPGRNSARLEYVRSASKTGETAYTPILFDHAVQANLADVGGLGDQVTKALKLEGLLCTERLVVRATSAP